MAISRRCAPMRCTETRAAPAARSRNGLRGFRDGCRVPPCSPPWRGWFAAAHSCEGGCLVYFPVCGGGSTRPQGHHTTTGVPPRAGVVRATQGASLPPRGGGSQSMVRTLMPASVSPRAGGVVRVQAVAEARGTRFSRVCAGGSVRRPKRRRAGPVFSRARVVRSEGRDPPASRCFPRQRGGGSRCAPYEQHLNGGFPRAPGWFDHDAARGGGVLLRRFPRVRRWFWRALLAVVVSSPCGGGEYGFPASAGVVPTGPFT